MIEVDWRVVFGVAFFIWSFPLSWFRLRFRKMAYETDRWTIAIKPVFWRELQVLFGFHSFVNAGAVRLIWFYRLYLVIYLLLLAGFIGS